MKYAYSPNDDGEVNFDPDDDDKPVINQTLVKPRSKNLTHYEDAYELIRKNNKMKAMSPLKM